MRNFQILIVTAVKICKQCLQTATPGVPPGPYWDFAPGHNWGT